MIGANIVHNDQGGYVMIGAVGRFRNRKHRVGRRIFCLRCWAHLFHEDAENKRCLNCGDLYPWWRRTCKHHVFKVRLVPASQDPYEHLRKVRADGSVNW